MIISLLVLQLTVGGRVDEDEFTASSVKVSLERPLPWMSIGDTVLPVLQRVVETRNAQCECEFRAALQQLICACEQERDRAIANPNSDLYLIMTGASVYLRETAIAELSHVNGCIAQSKGSQARIQMILSVQMTFYSRMHRLGAVGMEEWLRDKACVEAEMKKWGLSHLLESEAVDSLAVKRIGENPILSHKDCCCYRQVCSSSRSGKSEKMRVADIRVCNDIVWRLPGMAGQQRPVARRARVYWTRK